MASNKIIPLIEKCKCGNKVLNHHYLCDKCWGKNAKKEARDKKKEHKRKSLEAFYKVRDKIEEKKLKRRFANGVKDE